MRRIEYVEFRSDPAPRPTKTERWIVWSIHHQARLGRIQWYGPWRQYCFFPDDKTIWNIDCLQTIRDFIKEKMDSRRASAANR